MGLLDGVRVLDFGLYGAGPFCPRHLANLGADVIKVESLAGDPIRHFPPAVTADGGYLFHFYNTDKRSLAIDLKSPEGREIARSLIARSDVVVESYVPGVMQRLGLGYEVARELNPGIIYCSISGYGQSGPSAGRRALDTAIQATSGAMHVTGWADGPPTKLGVSIGDGIAPVVATTAILAALRSKLLDGKGRYIDIAMQESLAWLLQPEWNRYRASADAAPESRLGNRGRDHAPDNLYPTRDEWVAISCPTDQDWVSLAAAMGQPALAADARFDGSATRLAHGVQLDAIVAAWTGTLDSAAVLDACSRRGVPASRCIHPVDVLDRDDLRQRGMVVDLAAAGGRSVAMVGSPFRLSRTPGIAGSLGPAIGEHSAQVLRQVLELSDERIAELGKAGVIRLARTTASDAAPDPVAAAGNGP
ncbi:MAG: CaiB/BaiF CoA transferase family protein [Lautropia sp.]